MASIRDLPRSIWALFAVRLVVAAGNFVFPFLTLILTVKLGWAANRAGAFISAMQAASLPGLLLGGRLSDSLGRRTIILVCQGLAAALFFACVALGFREALPYLVALASMALSMTWPVSGALVADLVPAQSRKEAYALLYWGNNIGFSVGPLAAGFLFHRAPSLMFLGNAVALCSSLLIVGSLVPETRGKHRSRETAPGDRSEAPDETPYSGSLLGVLRERPTIIAFSVVVALMNLVYGQNSFGLPLFLNERLGERGPEVFGLAMTVNGLTVVLCTIVLTKLTSRAKVLKVLASAALLYGLGFGLLSLPTSLPLVLGSTIVWTFGEILSATNINVYVAARTPSSHRGRVNSFVSLVTNLGSLSGPAVAGLIVRDGSSATIWPLAAAVSLLAACLMGGLQVYDARLERRRKVGRAWGAGAEAEGDRRG